MKSLAHPNWPYTGTPWEWRGFADAEDIRWGNVNGDGFEYAIQQGPHGDEFVKLMNGKCLRRPSTVYQKQNFGPELK